MKFSLNICFCTHANKVLRFLYYQEQHIILPNTQPDWARFIKFQIDFFERLSASGVKSIVASQVAAAPLPVSAAVANSNKDLDTSTTMMPLESSIVPSIEEIYR